MKRPADTQHPIDELLKQRWSPLAFGERMVEREKLQSLLEAARWAPSCFNEQPWHFIVATKENPAEYDRLLGCLVEANQTWAKHAPVLMLSVVKLTFARNHKVNTQAQHDLGLAAMSLVIQAQSLGLITHQMGGFLADKARATYAIPQDCEPIAAIAVGYPGETDSLPPNLKERELSPRTRKPLKDFVFAGTWGHSSPLVL